MLHETPSCWGKWTIAAWYFNRGNPWSDAEEEILEESCEEIEKQNLSVCFSRLGVSPVKLHSQSV